MNKRRTLAVAAAAVVMLLALYVLSSAFLPFSHGQERPVEIPKGATLSRIADSLSENSIVRDRTVFLVLARLSGRAERLQSGLYRFPATVSALDVLRILVAGSHQAITRVSIPEGFTIKRIAARLEKATGLSADRFIALSRDQRFIDSVGLGVRSLEGYLLPDTYDIRYDAHEEQVLGRMVTALLRHFERTHESRRRERGVSLHHVLTMASLVEGETRLPEERARVAGVYYNRLRRGMLLQADPTVQYIIPDGPRRLLYRDLAINSPYNTYLYPGLPPGPVNNPGRDAIRAALYPESHDFYYFVADGHGGHVFTRNYAEHSRAVERYRAMMRSRE